MNPCNQKLYETILQRLEGRGVSLGEVLKKHGPANKQEWLLKHDGTPLRPRVALWPRRARFPKEILRDFVEKIEAKEQDRCWTWTDCCNPYGQFYVCRKVVRAHVLMKSLWDGLPPSYGGKHRGSNAVRHSCDNPKCCNPHHLLNGTVSDNIEDVYAHGKRRHILGFGSILQCPTCGAAVRKTGKQSKQFCSWNCYSVLRQENRSEKSNRYPRAKRLYFRAAREDSIDFILPHLARMDPNKEHDL